MTDSCPSLVMLQQMLDDSLPDAELGSIEAHVDSCKTCQDALEELTRPAAEGISTLWAGSETGSMLPESPGRSAGSGPHTANTGDHDSLPDVPGYEVERELGRGGMGVVYLARQVNANRAVAIKMMAGGHIRDEERIRFRLEGESLAQLRHPNIVQVYEVGSIGGRPFFSMEYIAGESLAASLAGSARTPREAAALVEVIARAVHAAHQCGVVHRDLKPANVLLDPPSSDAAPLVPKVTDFGLAKRVGADSGLTHTGQILGTPSYMAPEQASGGRAVGVPADVYALGAILYEALAARPPFRGGSAWDTMMQVVHTPATPPSRFCPGLPRDLEVICLKCLVKDPEGRYSGANALADDLRRWLAGEPIRARPARMSYRAWLWAKRRPAMAGLAALLVGAVLAGSAGILVQWRRAEAHLATAEARLSLAIEAIEGYHTGVSEDVLLREPKLKELRAKLLGSALKFYRKLQDEARQDGESGSGADLARAYERVADLTSDIGSKAEALKAYEHALAMRRGLADASPDDLGARRALADDYARIGRVQFEVTTPEVAATWHRLALAEHESIAKATRDLDDGLRVAADRVAIGTALAETTRASDALIPYDQAIGDLRDLLRTNPTEPRVRRELALALYASARVRTNTLAQDRDTIPRFRESADLLADLESERPGDLTLRKTRALALHWIGVAFYETGQLAESLEWYARSLEVIEPLIQAYPTILENRRIQADTRLGSGISRDALNRNAEAKSEYLLAIAIFEGLVQENPSVPVYRARLAACLSSLASLEGKLGDEGSAGRYLAQSIALRTLLSRDDPATFMYRVALGDDYGLLANQHRRLGRRTEARETYLKAIDVLQDLPDANLISLYNLACYYASAAELAEVDPGHATPAEDAERRRLADLAMIQLRKAVHSGYANAKLIEADRDLNVLRTRDDYRALIGDLQFPSNPFQK